MLDVVGGVHPHAGGLGVVEHGRVDRSVVGRGDDEAEAGDVAPSVRPALDRDIQRVDASIDLGRDHRHVGSGAEETLDLAQRNPSATDHQAATPGDLQHHGVHRHDAPRPRRRRTWRSSVEKKIASTATPITRMRSITAIRPAESANSRSN